MLLLKVIVIFFVLVLLFGLVILFVQWSEKRYTGPTGVGDPLFLTKYLYNTSILVAKEAALAVPFDGKTKSYSGFLTIDEEFESNIFFWYFPSEIKPSTAPVVIWMQGGPGVSSVYGVFLENGPYIIVGDDAIKKREDYWSKYLHVIFIDNTIGTGFSFTRNHSGYSTNGESVSENLYKALRQFFKFFPEILKNDLYIAGESYGGSYVPRLAKYIHDKNQNSTFKINLKGLSIGNGLLDASHQMVYSEYLEQISLIDSNQRYLFKKLQNKVIYLMKQEKWLEANHALSDLITNEYGRTTLFSNITGFKTITNYLVSDENYYFGTVNAIIRKHWLRRMINVGNTTFIESGRNTARRKLEIDLIKPSAPILAELLNDYRVLIYNGQLDIFLPYIGSEYTIRSLSWCGSHMFEKAKRTTWNVDGIVAGYTKRVKNQNCSGELILALVRNAGHLVPRDQPVWALNLIRTFTNGLPFN